MRFSGRGYRNLLLGVLAVLLLGWLLSRLEQAMIYHSAPFSGQTPARWGVPFQDIRLRTPDGEVLHGWWCPRPEPGAPRLLFFHGNAGNREDRLHNLAGLWRAGISVFLFDYRGYGGSSGTPSEAGLTTDGLAAFDWLAGQPPAGPVFLFGRSLGGAVAAAVARQRPAAGLILESTFTSAPEMAARVLPIPGIARLTRSRFDALAAVRAFTGPLLVIHGDRDELVPFAMGRELFRAAATPQKTFRAVPGGSHNDTYVVAGAAYFGWITGFLRGGATP